MTSIKNFAIGSALTVAASLSASAGLVRLCPPGLSKKHKIGQN